MNDDWRGPKTPRSGSLSTPHGCVAYQGVVWPPLPPHRRPHVVCRNGKRIAQAPRHQQHKRPLPPHPPPVFLFTSGLRDLILSPKPPRPQSILRFFSVPGVPQSPLTGAIAVITVTSVASFNDRPSKPPPLCSVFCVLVCTKLGLVKDIVS